MQALQALRATRRGSCNTGQAFGEGPARTGRNGRAEPPGVDAQRQRAALPGQVAKVALVAVMNAAGQGAARTRGWATMVTRSGVSRTCTTVRPGGVKGSKRIGKVGFRRRKSVPQYVRTQPRKGDRLHGGCG